MKFIYRDNLYKIHTSSYVVFEYEAPAGTLLSEADKEYEKHTGKDPRKEPWIGCEIIWDEQP